MGWPTGRRGGKDRGMTTMDEFACEVSDGWSRALAAEAFPEYILIGGPFDGQRGVVFHIPMAYLELPLNRGVVAALDSTPTPVARYDLVEIDGYPSRDDDGVYRYQWHGAEQP